MPMLLFAQSNRSITTSCCGATVAAMLALLAATSPTLAASCANPNALGTSRTLAIDPAEHIRLGSMQYRETLPLGTREVVLTFDDGPLPPYSSRILDVLAAECVKATYFMVGSMAKAHPRLVQRIAAAGHTIGTHSQNHPLTFNKMPLPRAKREINDGVASVSAALGGRQPAPFFRIPGLRRASPVEFYLATQGLMTWSADVPSDDWRRISADEIVRRTLARLEAQGKGMVLLHDIHPATALALPKLLRELKARDFRIVHVVPANGVQVKTATLPHQWQVRAAHRAPKNKQEREATDRRSTNHATAIVENRRSNAHAAVGDPQASLSGLFGIPRELLPD
jgi:peptidoglycan/xylan/chitin deacetylase (PgdA/CDA1 family)